jgi:hypothetical protein
VVPINQLIKKIWHCIRHGPFILYWIFYDYILTAWIRLRKIDYIGIYVGAMSKSEREIYFDNETVGGGYNGYAIIRLFFESKWYSARAVKELITHEVLHQVLYERISGEAYHKLDNVHFVRPFKAKDDTVIIWSMDFPTTCGPKPSAS